MGQTQLNSCEAGELALPVLIGSEPNNNSFPLSFAQESVWFLEQMVPGTPIYSLPEAWVLKGRLDLAALQQSLDEMARRHETLRTIFKANEGKPEQIILPSARIKLTVVDLSEARDLPSELGHQLETEARRPFILTSAPLARATLFKRAAAEHVLLLNQHHLISDAWSQELFMRELSVLYTAFAAGQPCSLPALPIQYADFALWQREMISSAAGRHHLAYWEDRFGTRPGPVLLPSDHPRRADRSYRGVTHFSVLSGTLVAALKDLSRQEGVTLFMTLLSAFQTLLQRYTHQKEIVVGSPMACRERLELAGLLGFFAHTHALRTDLSGDPTFVEVVRRVREVVLEAYAHQEVPCEMVMKTLPTERSTAGHPLFQVVFGWQSGSPQGWTMPGLEATRIELETGTAKFDWTVLVTEGSDGLRLRSEFSTELFDPATISRFMNQFQVLLGRIAASPGSRVSELPLLTQVERGELLTEWNRTGSEYERESRIHEIFEARAAETPKNIALEFQGRRMTYAELNRRANQLARRLKAAGVGDGGKVGLCLPRSFEMIIGMLAILKLGGAYVPLDSDYPLERLAFMLRDCDVSALITQSGRISDPELLGIGKAVIVLDRDQTALAQESSENLQSSGTATSLAYVVYTSGSTGTPKGTLIPHRAVVRLVRHSDYLKFSAEQVFLQAAPATFDAATFEIWGALLNGARLVILPPEMLSLEQLGRAIRDNQVTTLWLTAGLFDQMVDHRLNDLGGLKELLVGGDVLSPAHVSKALRHLKSCQLINGYGPTENTTFTCCYRVPSCWQEDRAVPIGRPIANTSVYVLDEKMNPVPIGMTGEIYCGGDGLALGYLNQAELTAGRFLPNPFSSTDGSRLYRTGDLARWMADGNLEFLGRTDEQVKIRGYRVEPGEVENALARHPSVESTVVQVRADRFGGKQLVGYVVERSGQAASPAELQEFLEGKLPAHLVPAQIVVLDALPLTPNGKVDRRSLPDPALGGARPGAAAIAAPRTDTEESVAKIWREILVQDQLSIHDDFFHLGGHSLLAMQMLSRISSACRVDLPVRSIFDAPTVAKLAALIESTRRDQAQSVPLAITRAGPARAAELLERLDEFTEAELEELLRDPELKSVL